MSGSDHRAGRPAIGRRELLRGTAALAVTPLLLSGLESCTHARPVTPQAHQVAPEPMGIDMHNHVYPAGTEPQPQHGGGPGGGRPPRGEPGQDGRPPEQPAEEQPELALADELQRSGFTAVCASYVLDFAPNYAPGDARENLLRWFTAIDAELEKGHVHRALRWNDLQAARARRKPVIIQSVEGAHFIEGQLERLEEVYSRGLRHLQLLHEKDDLVSPLGDTNTSVAHLGGLTAFGAEVVKECNRLGIVVDLAHANLQTVIAAAKLTTQPFIVSHTNLSTWTGNDPRLADMMKPRLISKEQARIVAGAGGVIGVWTHLTQSVSELVQSIRLMVDAVGVDHVGIGTDTDLLSSRAGQGTNRAWPELQEFFPAVVEEMRRQHFTAEEIGKIGGENFARVFGAVTAGLG